MEFPGVLARAEEPRPVQLPVRWARSVRLNGHEVLLVVNGIGWARAAAAVDAAAPGFHPDAVVTTGFCGALDDGLQTGDVVVGTSIRTASAVYPVAPLAGGRSSAGAICSLDHVAQTSKEKRQLRATGACAVEMEGAGVAERVQVLGLPLYCVKVVTDLAGETMANDFNKALRSDGQFDTIGILTASLRQPTVRIPELIRLRSRCVRAARVLGEFFANCRF
jgi:nucleoside phosphorylase